MTGPDPVGYGWWLAARASGLVALALVTASVIIGLLMASGLLRRPGLKRSLLAVHEHTALIALGAMVVHGATLMADRWLHPGLRGVLVPFVMSYRTAFTGLGIVAAYLAALLGLSFYARRRIGARLWRKAHRLTVVVYVLAVVHALGAGTDGGAAWLRMAVFASAVPIAALFLARVLPRRRPQRRTGAGHRPRAVSGERAPSSRPAARPRPRPRAVEEPT